jgi:putative hydrolase of HD superfamily
MNIDVFLDFLQIAGKLKKIPRTGWVESGIEKPESVADHSYRTALAAMILSDSLGLDTCKVLRMALMHDLAEVELGDVTPRDKKANHKESENVAIREIFSVFNTTLKELYWVTWLEYQEKKTPEAVLVHDVDKIEMIIQTSEYQRNSPERELNRFWNVNVSPMGKEIVDKIKERRDMHNEKLDMDT